MAVNPEIKKLTEKIRHTGPADQVRESIAGGMDLTSEEASATRKLADQTENRQTKVESDFKTLQQEYTENGNGAQTTAEISLARDGEPVLADRLNRDFGNITAQFQQTDEKLEQADSMFQQINIAIQKKANITYVDAVAMDIAKGGPKGPFYSINALKAAYPNGADGTWLVYDGSFQSPGRPENESAHSFMWDSINLTWKDLGPYQGWELALNSVTSDKRTVLGGLSFLSIGGTTKLPNINTTSKKIELSAPFSVIYGKKRASFASNIAIPFDAETFQYVLFDFDSSSFRMLRSTSYYDIKESEAIFMTVSFTTGTSAFVKSVYSTFDYTINDVVPNKQYRNGKLIPGSGATILLADFPTRKVSVQGLFFVNYDNRSVRFSSGAEVQIKGGGISHLFFDETNDTLFFEDTIGFNNRKKEWIYLGQFINDGSKFVHIDVSLPFKATPSMDVAVPKRPFYFSPEEITGYYEPDDTETYDLFSTDSAVTKVQHIYDKYEELRSAHPDYIKRTYLGFDQSGTYPIYEYQFMPSLLATPYLDATSNIQKIGSTLAKIIFIAGNHGQERNAIFATYYFLQDLCKNWETNKSLEYLRHNVEIKVIPIANPWSVENGAGRKNSRGVDINRNFDYGWVLGDDPSDPTYGGPAPFSEIESVYIKEFMERNKDAVFYGDFHNHSSTAFNELIWLVPSPYVVSPAIKELAIASRHTIQLLTRKFKKRYNFPDEAGHIGYITDTISGSAQSANYAAKLGISSSTFEGFLELPYLDGNSETIKVNTEYIGNYFLTILKTFKDSQ